MLHLLQYRQLSQQPHATLLILEYVFKSLDSEGVATLFVVALHYFAISSLPDDLLSLPTIVFGYLEVVVQALQVDGDATAQFRRSGLESRQAHMFLNSSCIVILLGVLSYSKF